MLPTEKRFEPDYLAGGYVADWLICDRQFLAFDRVAQVRLEVEAVPAGRVAVWPVEGDRGARLFGAVHGHLGALEQPVELNGVPREEGDASTGLESDVTTAASERAGHCADHPLGRHPGRRLVGGRKQDGEVVPSDAGNVIATAHYGSESIRKVPEEAVALGPAQGVVDRLEPVDVEQYERAAPTALRAA